VSLLAAAAAAAAAASVAACTRLMGPHHHHQPLLLLLLLLQELRSEVEAMDARGTRGEGPRLVARAWLDPGFKERLLQVRFRAHFVNLWVQLLLLVVARCCSVVTMLGPG
jgi:hypothetical protein